MRPIGPIQIAVSEFVTARSFRQSRAVGREPGSDRVQRRATPDAGATNPNIDLIRR